MAGVDVGDVGLDIRGLSQLFKQLARDQSEHIGLLFGRGRVVQLYMPLSNIMGSPAAFTGDPWDVVVAFTAADKYGLSLLGVFHTHPCGEPAPSRTDIDGMRRWPYIWVIASPSDIKAWRLVGGMVVEVGVLI